MNKKEFESKISTFDPPWLLEGECIYCPLYMKPKDGYVGRTLPEDEHFDYIWKDMQKYKGIYNQEQLFIKFANYEPGNR